MNRPGWSPRPFPPTLVSCGEAVIVLEKGPESHSLLPQSYWKLSADITSRQKIVLLWPMFPLCSTMALSSQGHRQMTRNIDPCGLLLLDLGLLMRAFSLVVDILQRPWLTTVLFLQGLVHSLSEASPAFPLNSNSRIATALLGEGEADYRTARLAVWSRMPKNLSVVSLG